MTEFKTIKRDEDGKYVWIYELNLLTNPIVYFTIMKIFFFIDIGIWIFLSLFDIGNAEALLGIAKTALIMLAVFAGLTLIGYLVYALIMGGKYIVLFIMDEEGVIHRQLDKQVKKAQATGALAVLLGAASGNVGAMGTGILSMTKSESQSEFSKVRKVKSLRIFNTIKVDALLNHNQVYVPKEDFSAVLEYINARCVNKK